MSPVATVEAALLELVLEFALNDERAETRAGLDLDAAVNISKLSYRVEPCNVYQELDC